MEKIEFILNEFNKCDIKLSTEQAERFNKLYEFLVEYNKNVNLTAITDFKEIVVKHFIDSVLPFNMIGAGFPSIPLMIVRPDLKCTMLEALNKRCVFLEKACELVGVKATVVHGRAEDYAKDRRECFDFATARAVANMSVLSEYCMPYVKVGGKFIALKSVNEEIEQADDAIKILGGKITNISDYKITNGDSRRLVVIDKLSHTPTKYPRNPSMINKKPL